MSGARLEYQSWSILKVLTKRVLRSWGPVGLRFAKHSVRSRLFSHLFQLIDTIRAHVKPDLSPPSDEDTEGMLHLRLERCTLCLLPKDLFCLSKCVSSEDSPTLAAAFEEKARSTHKLVAAFVQLNGVNSLGDEIYRRYQRTQTEVCFLCLSNTT
jgi:hypothetical protein